MEMFQRLEARVFAAKVSPTKFAKVDSWKTLWLATNCPCTSICRNDREEYTKNVSLLRKLGYSLENGAHYYFNTGSFENYDDVVETLVERLVEKPNFLDIGKKAEPLLVTTRVEMVLYRIQ